MRPSDDKIRSVIDRCAVEKNPYQSSIDLMLLAECLLGAPGPIPSVIQDRISDRSPFTREQSIEDIVSAAVETDTIFWEEAVLWTTLGPKARASIKYLTFGALAEYVEMVCISDKETLIRALWKDVELIGNCLSPSIPGRAKQTVGESLAGLSKNLSLIAGALIELGDISDHELR